MGQLYENRYGTALGQWNERLGGSSVSGKSGVRSVLPSPSLMQLDSICIRLKMQTSYSYKSKSMSTITILMLALSVRNLDQVKSDPNLSANRAIHQSSGTRGSIIHFWNIVFDQGLTRSVSTILTKGNIQLAEIPVATQNHKCKTQYRQH